jgi:transcriptional regulator with XRE-family HTH domain
VGAVRAGAGQTCVRRRSPSDQGGNVKGGVAGMVDPQTIIEAKRTLGRQLAALREAAGKTQDQLAKQIKYGRSTIANAETGYSTCRRTFWEHADRALHANGSLLAGYDELQTLTRQRHADHAHLMGQRRTAAFRKIQDQQESDDQRPPLMSVTPSAARSTHWSASSGDNAPTALLSPDVEPPADHRRRVGEGTVRDLAARVHRFRLADDILAGGDLVVPAIRDLRAAVRLYRQSSY